MSRNRAPLSRRVREWAKTRLRFVFELGQRIGIDVLPRHFYSEIPDIRALQQDRSWQRPYTLAGVSGADLDEQLSWLRETCPPDLAETFPSLRLQERAGAANGALGYGKVEADILYSVVFSRRPARVVMVGAGAATWIVLEAAKVAGYDVDVVCVDPYPTKFLQDLSARGSISLIREPVQSVPMERLVDLRAGDVFFVDSTHTVSIGSDVNYLVLEVFPRLPEGVLLHLHDITMPYDYFPHALSSDLFFWNESVLLHAFLIDNHRFRIRLGCAMLHDAAIERVQAILPTYGSPLKTERGLAVGNEGGEFPASMWLDVVAEPSAPT